MRPHLISFKLCPFVQRVAIALEHKQVEYSIDYVDLADPPDWFMALSPLKKVPVLQVGEAVLFESAAILEYVDEAHDPRLHPADLVRRARNRAWMEFGNQCMWEALRLTTKESEGEFHEVVDTVHEKFDQLETAVETPFFNGDEFGLIDASFAPLLQRLQLLDDLRPGILDRERHPDIDRWKDALLELESVHRSHVPELGALYHDLIWKRQGFISRFVDASGRDRPIEKSRY